MKSKNRSDLRIPRLLAVLAVAASLTLCSGSALTSGASGPPECRVGLVMPTTGEMAPYGAEGVLAARLAFEDAKAAAKYSKPLLFEQDSASQVEQANSAAAVLVAPPTSVNILVGEINSDDTAAMVSPARTVGVPIVAPTASRISLTSMSDRIFRIWPSDAYEAASMKTHLMSVGVKRVAVLFIQVQYGEEMARAFEHDFRAAGGEVQLEGYRRETVDFKPLLRRVASFDTVYLISYVDDAAVLLKQAYEINTPGQRRVRFFGTTVLDSDQLIRKAGRAAEGITFAVVQAGTGGDESKRTSFSSKYQISRRSAGSVFSAAANEPTFAGFHVYDAASLAFASCDATAQAAAPQGAAIINYLRTMPQYVGVTGEIKFDEKGDLAAARSVVFKQVTKGKIVPLAEQ